MNETNVGKNQTFKDGVYMEIVNEQKVKETIVKYNLKDKKGTMKDPTTEAAIIYSKKGGEEGYLLLLPTNPGKDHSFLLNKDVVDDKHPIEVLLSLYT